MFDRDDKITEVKVLSVQVVLFRSQKLKLKEDEDGNKVTDVRGIRANAR